MDEFKEIPVDRIVWKSPARPLDIEFARRLSKNIRHRGQLQEITVAPLKRVYFGIFSIISLTLTEMTENE